ncbi:hypothetical protein F2Q69_00001196, partial [Brassica cretica]
DKTCVVLVATGSFNPPTFMHFTHVCWREMHYTLRDFMFLEAICLLQMMHTRRSITKAACFIDSTRIYASLSTLCVLKVRSICKDYGIVCIRREGQDVENMIFGDRILYETRVSITKFLVSLYQSVK